MPGDLTIGEYLRFLLGRRNLQPCPAWPPDVFACCASLLLKSGSYARILTDWPPRAYRRRDDKEAWARAASRYGRSWRAQWVRHRTAPAAVRRLWTALANPAAAARPVGDLNEDLPLWQAAMQLLAIADEACESVGSPVVPSGDEHGESSDGQPSAEDVEAKIDEIFLQYASELLQPNQTGSSVCLQVSPSRVRVLPKMHTPQNGITIRSLSLYLALCTPGEVRPMWVRPVLSIDQTSLNLLVVPWPPEIHPVQFRPSTPLPGESANMPERFQLFTYDHRAPDGAGRSSLMEHVVGLHRAAIDKIGRVDAIILPECAIAESDHAPLRQFALSNGAVLVSGLGAAPTGREAGLNRVCLDLPLSEPLMQAKHHRWKLDAGQITQYGLGSILDPESEWWEHIGIEDRQFYFAYTSAEIVLSVLICEDLARPDPVGDLVRAVGPNLVIALLMDGPQLKERWAARYATVLADDPGCSVLSITSLGMSRLSRPRDGRSRNRVVALWKDAKTGGPYEIELDDGCDGVILSLAMRRVEEWTADGRSDGRNALYPILSGVHCVKRYTEGEADHT
ncbi:MAG: hypothetical protein QM757_19470 [Paludibaculum sp.]